MTDPTTSFATPRIAAGAMFIDGDRVLLVHKAYGNGWDVPADMPTQANHQQRPVGES